MSPLGLDILLRTPGFRRAYVLRAIGLWAMMRAVYFWMAGPSAAALLPVFFIVGMTAFGVIVDARRRNEDLFLANLGVSLPAIAVLAGAGPVFIEFALMVVA